ncbi:diacylglycerol/lipid kinase family protein [Noviherbaspirillum aerium]|uniref:diacylglycerol/lipid kinase family protein n=1 Tax=Noviherbaspirillum aerium TaxID=2588497 RepID=UPI00178C5E1F|nr:diacylglycerol kinase family protein [Noviherbaspirillum aerium]
MTGSFSRQPRISENPAITVLLNARAGDTNAAAFRKEVTEALTSAGASFKVMEMTPGSKFLEAARQSVLQAKTDDGLIVAAGGDGTINTVAALCCEHDVKMGIIPAGTFNYFARDLSIPTNAADAARVLVEGKIERVSVGYINDRIFLNNASFGLYSKLIQHREEVKSRFGRFRIVAVFAALVSLFRGQKPFAIALHVGKETLLRRTCMVFVTNNLMQLSHLDKDVAEQTPEDGMAVFVMRPTTRLDMCRLILRGVMRNLASDSHLETFCTDRFDVESRRSGIDVVVDGEIVRCRTPLSFRVARRALQVVVPARDDA